MISEARFSDVEVLIDQNKVLRVGQEELCASEDRARYNEAIKGSLRIAPPEHRVSALREDYRKMEQMFFNQAPEFDNIVALLAQWEREFNQK